MTLYRLSLAVLLLIAASIPEALAQISTDAVARVVASDAASGDRFGFSVSVSGDRAIVGAYSDDSGQGAAYVFVYDGTSWVHQAKLTASDGSEGDAFGTAVAILGDRAVVTTNRSSGSAAYVFVFGTVWTQQAKLIPLDGGGGERFGSSVSISGDRVLVGASSGQGNSRGAAYVFAFDGTSWSQQQKLTVSGGSPGDYFGYDVSISGDRALVGAYGSSAERGAAYVFDYTGTSWVQRARLFPTDLIPGDRFGISVSVTGDRALIGADEGGVGGSAGGKAYVFALEGTSWSQQQKLTASDRPPNFIDRRDDRFGVSVALSGDEALIGATFAPSAADETGAAYQFAFDGTSWTELAKLTASDGARDDRYGNAVSLSVGAAIVGAWGDDGGTGSATLYGTPEVEPSLAVTAPTGTDVLAPGEPFTIRFEAPDATNVDLFLVARSQSSSGAATLIASDVPAAGGVHEWDVPEDLLSPSTFILVKDATDASREGVSERFRVRDKWHLTRVVGTLAKPEYEPFEVASHSWSASQANPNLWPRSYWDILENDYFNGFDPFYVVPPGAQGVSYSGLFRSVDITDHGVLPVDFGGRYLHPQWPNFVRSFDTNYAYKSLVPTEIRAGELYFDNPNPMAFRLWKEVAMEHVLDSEYGTYQGACFGYSLSVLGAFGDPDRFAARFPQLTADQAKTIGTLPLSDVVRDVIHIAHNYQLGNDFKLERLRAFGNLSAAAPETPRDLLRDVKVMLQLDTRDQDFVLSWVASLQVGGVTKRAAHGVIPYRLERVTDEGVFRLSIIDPNEGPSEAPHLVLDSLANTWSYPNSSWVGTNTGGLYSSLESRFVYERAAPPQFGIGASRMSSRRSGVAAHEMFLVTAATSTLIAEGGGSIHFDGNTDVDGLDGAIAWYEETGRPSIPTGYVAVPGDYTLELASGERSATGVHVLNGTRGVGYNRNGSGAALADEVHITSSGVVDVAFESGEASEGSLEAWVEVGAEARSLSATGFSAEAAQSVTLDASGEDTFALAAQGAVDYDLTLLRTLAGDARAFFHSEVSLPAGAAHTIRPDWSALGDGPVQVDVDLDGDGTADQILMLENQGLPVAGEPGAKAPSGLALSVYPNPARGDVMVEASVSEAGSVRIEVYDVLGRRMAVIHEGPLAVGVHVLAFDSRGWPNGVYTVRMIRPDGSAAIQLLTVVR